MSDVDSVPATTETQMGEQGGNTAYATEVHKEYMTEVQHLIDEQVEALFNVLANAASSAGASTPDEQATVRRVGRSLTISRGPRQLVATVDAVTDDPNDAARARDFPSGQARCTVILPDGTTNVYVLHRQGTGDTVSYAWMPDRSETPVSNDDLDALVQSLYA